MLVLCHHASLGDASEQKVARLQAQLIKDKYDGIKILSGMFEMDRTRATTSSIVSRSL